MAKDERMQAIGDFRRRVACHGSGFRQSCLVGARALEIHVCLETGSCLVGCLVELWFLAPRLRVAGLDPPQASGQGNIGIAIS